MRSLTWNKIIPYDEMPTDPKIMVYEFSPMDKFTKKFLHIYKKAIRWTEYNLFSVIVKLENGDTYFYNSSDNRLILVRLFDNLTELTEEEWKNGLSYFLDRKIWLSGLTKRDVAEAIDISVVQLSKYIHGKAVPSSFVLHKISDVIGCDINDVLPHDFVPIKL